MNTTLGATGLFAWALLLGCSSSTSSGGSSGSGGETVAGASGGGAAGTPSSGGNAGLPSTGGTGATGGKGNAGSGNAGTGNAGTGNAGTGGGSATNEAKCSPGTTLPGINAYPGTLHNCGFTGTGMLAGVQAYYRSIKLDTPLAPGGTYAFSADMMTSAGKMELWGGSGECGDALELLATHNAGEGVRCMTASPKTGTYSYLIWVWYVSGTHGDVTFCPGGTCG